MARIKRTHTVARNMIHGDMSGFQRQYTAGEEITFGAEMSDAAIKELVENGTLKGPKAAELEDERKFNEKAMGVVGPSATEEQQLWKTFTKLSPEERQEREKREARIQDTNDAARLANLADARDRTGPDDDAVGEE
jgi:hypothetical protein